MKTSVQLYGSNTEGTPKIPTELANLREFVLTFIAGFMRVYGIAKLGSRPNFVGIKNVTDVSFKPLGPGIPKALERSRNYMVRQLADIATLFGILEVEILPDKQELAEMASTWDQLTNAEKGKPDIPEMPSLQEIRLDTDTDPTGEAVVDDEPKEKADSGAEGGEPSATSD